MTNWLEPLIDPLELVAAAQRGNREPRIGLAILLSGDLPLYERVANESDWPHIGSRPRRNASPDIRLLAAVGLHLTGSPNTTQAYRGLDSPRVESSFRTVAAVLLALHLADNDDLEPALGVLRSRFKSAQGALERTLLQLHIGIYEADRDNLDAALEATSLARKERAARGERTAHQALRTVADYNRIQFMWLRGVLPDPSKLPLRGLSPALLRGAADLASGLAEYLNEQFELLTADPNSRSVRWRAADPIDLELSSALWRAQCLADWTELRRARGLLGRYYVASRIGTPDGVAPEAFNLLRRAGDEKAARAAARAVAAIGPLISLQGEVEAVLQLLPWPRTQRAAIFALLESGADLLSSSNADRAFSRLRDEQQLIVEDARNGLNALARIVQAASDRVQTAASRLSRTLVETWPEHSLLIQDMARVIGAIRWSAVSAAERRHWLSYLETHITAASDHRFLAERVASELSSVDRAEVARVLVAVYDEQPNLVRLALVTGADIRLSGRRRQEAIAIAAREVRRIRDSAHKGSYGLGRPVDPAALLLTLVSRSPRDPAWDELVSFLLDDSVGVRDKASVLDRLADPSVSIPRSVQEELRPQVDRIAGYIDPLGPSESSLRGRTLRLGLRLGGIERKEILAHLIALTGDPDSDGRLEGARTLPLAQRRIGDDVAFTLGLALTRDRDYTVRGAGARALARLRRENAGELADLTVRRLESLLGETGAAVPTQTLIGLIESSRDGQKLHQDLLDAAARVSHLHASARVRQLAGRLLLEASDGQRT
jgi:hypothetical protein